MLFICVVGQDNKFEGLLCATTHDRLEAKKRYLKEHYKLRTYGVVFNSIIKRCKIPRPSYRPFRYEGGNKNE